MFCHSLPVLLKITFCKSLVMKVTMDFVICFVIVIGKHNWGHYACCVFTIFVCSVTQLGNSVMFFQFIHLPQLRKTRNAAICWLEILKEQVEFFLFLFIWTALCVGVS